MNKTNPGYLIELAKEEVCISTTYKSDYEDDPDFVEGKSEAFIEDDGKKILVAEATIYAINKQKALNKMIYICDEVIESSDLLHLSYTMNELCDEKSEWYDEEIDCSLKVYFIEHFKVCSEFRGFGMAREIARKMLINAGATYCPIFLVPDTYSDENGPGIEVVEKFWLGLQENIRIVDESIRGSRKVFYTPEFH